MSRTTYYQRNREVVLKRTNKYYENNKEVLREKAKNKYRELSEEVKNIKREYGRNRYHNMSEEKKRIKEYQKNYCEARRHLSINSVIKKRYKIATTKILFISAAINFIKDKTVF